MAEPNNPSSIKYCTVPAQIPIQFYICYDQEECCEYGCCTKPVQHFYQVWYFWFIVTLILLGVVAFCWACKHAKNATAPERCCQEIGPRVPIREFVIEATRQEQEPPSYSDAVAKIGGMYVPPPDYYSATTQQ